MNIRRSKINVFASLAVIVFLIVTLIALICRSPSMHWYDLPLDFEQRKSIPFHVSGKNCSVVLVRIQGVHDLSGMWGGSPVAEGDFVAVAVECEGQTIPLRGTASAFLNLHAVSSTGDKLFFIGGDGGLAWRSQAELNIQTKPFELKIIMVEDEQALPIGIRL